MRRRELLTLPWVSRLAAAPARPPNIVWIMGDDLGYGDLGCYGQRIIRTPHIDRLAADGTRFTDAYAGCCVCAPSRSVLMTGKHMGHTSVRSNPGGVPILAEDVSIAEVLRQAHYVSGCFGKWGLGDLGTSGVPWKQGFDEFFGFLHQVHAHYQYPSVLYHNDREYPLPGNGRGRRDTFANDAIAEKALAFIRRAKDKPFFCYMPFTVPHWEPQAPEDAMAPYRAVVKESAPYIDKTGRLARQEAPRAAYAGMVARLDSYVGRVLHVLGELGLEDRTLVVFCSDNGGAMPAQDPEDYFRSNGPLRGAKGTLYEGGVRVPMVVRWPGRIPAKRTSNFAWMFQDCLPTLADLAGVAAPAGIDGMSVRPALLGSGQKPHEALYWESPAYNWKTEEFRRGTPVQAARVGYWKAVRPAAGGRIELYDLRTDIGESRDVSEAQPEVMSLIGKYLASARTEPRPQGQPPHSWVTRS